ncbi:protein transport protein SEC31-like [Aplysia californica]|uniref:Protein transport protein SEC31-like n=1 Tax=Aplysia californica TaxID=6500 RepID=A0ABM1ABD5_APLCA|nr:protein transport protein SEC31-like [Aplysia californica]
MLSTELVKRQKGLGQALPSLDDQQEASLPEGLYPEMNPALQQQLMLLQLQQQQQALMALRNGARDRGMPPMEDLRAASMDPRLAMMMNGPPMQTPMPPSMMAPDMLRGAMPTDMRRMPGNDAPGVPEPFQDLRPMPPGQETGRPYRQRIRSFLEKLKAKVAERKAEASPEKRKGGDRARALRARMMMRLAAANGAPNPMMGPGPVMGQSPMMGPSVMGPYPAMGQNPLVQNPMMGRHPMMQNPMMGQHPMAQNPMMGQHPMAQNPMVGRHPMAQNPMMGPHPVPQNPMIGQNPMMQNPMMGPRPMTPRPPLQRPGMLPPMAQRTPGLPTSPSDPRSLNGQSRFLH